MTRESTPAQAEKNKKVKNNERVKHCIESKGLHESNLKNFIKYLLDNYNVQNTNIAVVDVLHPVIDNFLPKKILHALSNPYQSKHRPLDKI